MELMCPQLKKFANVSIVELPALNKHLSLCLLKQFHPNSF